jgi:hypothetical protein
MFSKKNEEENKEKKPSGIGEKFKGIFRKKAETPKTEEIDLEKTEIKVNSNDEIVEEKPENAEEKKITEGKIAEVKEITEVPTEEIPEEKIEPENVKEAPKEERKEVKKKERHKKENEIVEEEKAVGEILTEKHEEETGISPYEIQKEVAGTKVKIEKEIDLEKILMDTEKLRAELDALKEIKFNADERIKELAESIGEIRSLIFQNDATGKEIEMKVDKIDEIVSDLKPEKIARNLQEKQQAIEQTQIRIEKLEAMNADLTKKVLSAEKALSNIKSLENLMEIVKDIDEKVLKINELKSSTERDSAKAERFYMEIGKSLEEFDLLKERLERLEEVNKELIRGIDENKIKLDNAVTRDELKTRLETALKPPTSTENIEELSRRAEDITNFLKQLELQYKEGIISKGSYEEVVEKNKSILERIENDVKDVKTKGRPTNLIAWISEIEDELKNFKSIVSDIKEELEKQKSVIEDVLELKGEKSLSSKEEKKTNELEKQAIKNLLASLEDEYREGSISEKTYTETRDKNIDRLSKIEESGEENNVTEPRYEPEKEIESLKHELSKIKEEEIESLKHELSKIKEEESLGEDADRLTSDQHMMLKRKNRLITRIYGLERKIEELEQKPKHNPIAIE